MPGALVAFGAAIETRRQGGAAGRTIPLGAFYRLPGATPDLETVLEPGEIITAITVPTDAATARSTYVKVRDRQSYAYALCSVAIGIAVENGVVRDIRLAAGGIAPKPWRLDRVEAALRGRAPTADNIAAAARLAADGTVPRSENGFKVTLLVNLVRRAIGTVAA